MKMTSTEFEFIERYFQGAGFEYRRALISGQEKTVIIVNELKPDEFSESLLEKQLLTFEQLKNTNAVLTPVGIKKIESEKCLILESNDSVPLVNYLQQNKVTPTQALQMAVNLTRAIQQIHLQGYMIVQLNPALLLIDSATKEFSFINTRFFFKGNCFCLYNTHPEYLKKTFQDPCYLSPELCHPVETRIDNRSDLFQTGILIYEWLSGKKIFSAEDAFKTVISVLESEPPRPGSVIADISKNTESMILKLLAKDPCKRYQNTQCLLEDLQLCLEIESGKKPEIANTIQKNSPQIINPVQAAIFHADQRYELINDHQKSILGARIHTHVYGEAGSGKTFLIKSIQPQVQKCAGLFLYGNAADNGWKKPYDIFCQTLSSFYHQLSNRDNGDLRNLQKTLQDELLADFSRFPQLQKDLELFFGSNDLEMSIFELLHEQTPQYFQFLFVSFFRILASRKLPLVLALDNIQYLDQFSSNLLNKIINTSQINYLHCITSSNHRIDAPLQDIEDTNNTSQKNQIQLPNIQQKSLSTWVENTVGVHTNGLEALQSLAWNKSKGHLKKAQYFLSSLQARKMIFYSPANMCQEFHIDDLQIALIQEQPVQMALNDFRTLGDLEQEIIFTLSCIGKSANQNQLQSLLENSTQTRNYNDALVLLINAGYIKYLYSHRIDYYKYRDETTKEAGLLIYDDQIKCKKIIELINNSDEQDSLLSHWDITRLIIELPDSNIQNVDQASLKIISENLEKSALHAIVWGEHSTALQICEKGEKICNNPEQESDLFSFQLLKYYLNNRSNSTSLHNNSSLDNFIGKLSTHQNLLLDFVKIIILKDTHKAMAIEQCAKTLKHNGVRLPRKLNPLRNHYPVKKSFIKIIQKSWSKGQPASQIQILQNILLQYSDLLIDQNTWQHSSSLMKAFELGLKYNLNNQMTSIALARAAVAIHSRPREALELVSWQKSKLQPSALADAIIFKYIDCWNSPYEEWYSSFQKIIKSINHEMVPELVMELLVDQAMIRFFNSSTDQKLQIDGVNRLLQDFKSIERTEPIVRLKQLQNCICILAGTPEKEATIDMTRATDAHYQPLLEMAGGLHLGESNSSTVTRYSRIYQSSKTPKFISNIHNFYNGIYFITQYNSSQKKEKVEIKKKLALILNALQIENELQPDAQPHRYLYLKTLSNNLNLQNPGLSTEGMDQAIELAKHNHCLLDAALMSRTTGILYLDQGSQSIARSYIQNAFEIYEGINATGICNLLQQHYPDWIQLHQKPVKNQDSVLAKADPGMKDAHEFYFSLNQLNAQIVYQKIVSHCLQDSKATKVGLFKNNESGDLILVSKGTNDDANTINVDTSPPTDEQRFFPQSILDSVHRSRQMINIANFSVDSGLYSGDPYFSTRPIQSLFCYPFIHQNNYVGILYIENEHSRFTEAFNKSRKFLHEIDTMAQSLYNLHEHKSALALIQKSNKLYTKEKKLHRQSLEEQKILNQQIHKLEEKRSLFLAGLSDKINEPVRRLESISQNIDKLDPDYQKQQIIKNVTHLKEIISGILKYSELKTRSVDSEPGVFFLAKCLRSVVDKYAKNAARKNIEIIYELSAHLPNRIIGEESQLSQILDNLLNNAVRFTHSGEIYIQVNANQEDVLHTIEFIIKDTGRGMTAQKQQTVLNQSLDTSAELPESSGLGLIIAKRLCQIMGGSIEVASEPGKGSTFRFTIKALAVQTTRIVLPNAEIISGKKILLVDDNLSNRRIIRHSLRSWGSFPMAAISAKAALELIQIKENKFSLAIIDNDMPAMDGLELAKKIRGNKNTRHIAIILLINPLDTVENYQESSHIFQQIIQKPVNIDAMQQYIITLLMDAKARYASDKKSNIASSLGGKRFD